MDFQNLDNLDKLETEKQSNQVDINIPRNTGKNTLPIDKFEDDILQSINQQRVTIIHGQTGCGKSSRVPVMIMRSSQNNRNKIFISQPRRIAVKSLVERIRSLEPDFKNKIALRMGHGESQYESKETMAWFTTTGYLVRLLANNPRRFDDVSHLIIDEVHERSIDSDILCLLCRRLLGTNPHIKLVLMSATLASEMYTDYFNVTTPPIKVGGRRFPITEFFLEDILTSFQLSKNAKNSAIYLRDQCEKSKCLVVPSNTYMTHLYQLAVQVAAKVGKPGGSVLIFVSGMNDIVSIIDIVEKLCLSGVKYTCFPIHSEVPFEEQMAAFDKPAADEIKIIIGTNAAESSITLPNVDHVICLGIQKQIVYNASSNRQLLTPAWISRANALQRAGRTGRVRNGNVYRLYTKTVFNKYMRKFELGEMSRVPLDSVILDLKEILDEPTAKVLSDCLEAPDIANIERSFESLYEQNFISEPDDSGIPTTLGSFVSILGIDLILGSLIGLGIQFGVGPEAIEIAAILSFSKSPWIISSPLFFDDPKFNDMTSRTFMSRNHFDASLYSETLSIMNLLWDYERIVNKRSFSRQFCLVAARVRQLRSTRNSLRSRVANYLNCDQSEVNMSLPPSQMPHSKIVILRIIQAWVFKESLIKSYQIVNSESKKTFAVTLRKNQIEIDHLSQILNFKRHKFKLVTLKEIEYKGSFTPSEYSTQPDSFISSFHDQYLLFCAKMEFNMAWYRIDNDTLVLIVRDIVASSISIAQMKSDLLADVPESEPKVIHVENKDAGVSFISYHISEKDKITKLAKFLRIKSLQTTHVQKTISCHIFIRTKGKKRGAKPLFDFSFFLRGECGPLSRDDAKALFSANSVEISSRESGKATQEVQFKVTSNIPMRYNGNNRSIELSRSGNSIQSCIHPLLNDIPEGARILSVLASERRHEHFIMFSSTNKDGKSIKTELSRSETKINERWNSMRTGKPVFLDVNSVVAASLSLDGPTEVFGIAGDSLELKNGGIRVSGITLLPPGRLFPLLCLKTFGLHPTSASYRDEDEELDQCLQWLNEKNTIFSEKIENEATEKIMQAIEFAEQCKGLGDKLVCQPQLIIKILSIFNLVDGYECTPWEDISAESGVMIQKMKKNGKNMNIPRRRNKTKAFESHNSGEEKSTSVANVGDGEKDGKAHKVTILRSFGKRRKKIEKRLFATTGNIGTTVKESDFPSTNILSMLLEAYRKEVEKKTETNSASIEAVPAQWAIYEQMNNDVNRVKMNDSVLLDSSQWEVYQVSVEGGQVFWSAAYIAADIPLVPLAGRSKIPDWITSEQAFPSKLADAKNCIPPHVATKTSFWPITVIMDSDTTKRKVTIKEMIFFSSLEEALRVGAAYWLERQFLDGDRHWYHVQFNQMVEFLKQNML